MDPRIRVMDYEILKLGAISDASLPTAHHDEVSKELQTLVGDKDLADRALRRATLALEGERIKIAKIAESTARQIRYDLEAINGRLSCSREARIRHVVVEYLAGVPVTLDVVVTGTEHHGALASLDMTASEAERLVERWPLVLDAIGILYALAGQPSKQHLMRDYIAHLGANADDAVLGQQLPKGVALRVRLSTEAVG